MDSYILIPVRCTCGKIIGKYQKKYENLLEKGFSKEEALNELNIMNICCRMGFISPIKVFTKTINYIKEINSKTEKLSLKQSLDSNSLPSFNENKSSYDQEANLYPDIDLDEPADISRFEKKREQQFVYVGEGYKVPIQTPRIFSDTNKTFANKLMTRGLTVNDVYIPKPLVELEDQ
jgi:DNA-directed RNA polymerase subunit N (RpoN/RPB10)